jgi:hypothetical protein
MILSLFQRKNRMDLAWILSPCVYFMQKPFTRCKSLESCENGSKPVKKVRAFNNYQDWKLFSIELATACVEKFRSGPKHLGQF